MELLAFTFGMIGITMALYAASRYLRTKLGLGAGTVSMESLRIVGKRQLDNRKSLYVVEVGERYLIVGAAEGSVTLVDHITADEFAAMSRPAPDAPVVLPNPRAAFTSMLDRARSFNELRAAAQGKKTNSDDDAGVIDFETSSSTAEIA